MYIATSKKAESLLSTHQDIFSLFTREFLTKEKPPIMLIEVCSPEKNEKNKVIWCILK